MCACVRACACEHDVVRLEFVLIVINSFIRVVNTVSSLQ